VPLPERVWRRYKDKGVIFIGVDYVDTEPAARAFLAEFDVTYPNGPDLGGKISRAYRIRGVPETFFIDRDGQMADVEIGPLAGEARLVSAIEALLGEDQ
jgi:cytochrome c biogenesis protein CcmG/thiol:disulfide interchange protein DsbE